uniref:Uncharacterized protein n=1 Tax=Rhizophora mucronata TaxID=61149 RepID=A0A2P2PGG0_RHIMU
MGQLLKEVLYFYYH